MPSTYHIAECLCSLNQTAPIMRRLQNHSLSNSQTQQAAISRAMYELGTRNAIMLLEQKCDVTTTVTGLYKALSAHIDG